MNFDDINQLIKDVFPTILDLKFAVDRELLKGRTDLEDIYVIFLHDSFLKNTFIRMK